MHDEAAAVAASKGLVVIDKQGIVILAKYIYLIKSKYISRQYVLMLQCYFINFSSNTYKSELYHGNTMYYYHSFKQFLFFN